MIARIDAKTQIALREWQNGLPLQAVTCDDDGR